jgi:hypothetical protein
MADWKRTDPESYALFINRVVEFNVEMERSGRVMVEAS